MCANNGFSRDLLSRVAFLKTVPSMGVTEKFSFFYWVSLLYCPSDCNQMMESSDELRCDVHGILRLSRHPNLIF